MYVYDVCVAAAQQCPCDSQKLSVKALKVAINKHLQAHTVDFVKCRSTLQCFLRLFVLLCSVSCCLVESVVDCVLVVVVLQPGALCNRYWVTQKTSQNLTWYELVPQRNVPQRKLT